MCKKRLFKASLIITMLCMLISSSSFAQNAVRNLPDGWTHEVIYQSDFVSPSSMCLNGDNDLLVLDNSMNKIVIMDEEYNFTTYISLDTLHLSSIAYQPLTDRLIGFAGGNIYSYQDGEFQYLNTIEASNYITTIAINPDNDYFYGASLFPDAQINYYDSNGNLIETIVEGTMGCTQIAYDIINQKLYYSETYTGEITECDLQSQETSTLITGLGIPETDEAIAVALDENNNLYFYTTVVATSTYNGLNIYSEGSFTQIMESGSAMGTMIWLPGQNSFINTSSAGGNLVLYDLTELTSEELFPSVNTSILGELQDSSVIFGMKSQLHKIEDQSHSELGNRFEDGLIAITFDSLGNIYGVLFDRNQIIQIEQDASYEVLVQEFSDLHMGYVYYDLKNHALIIFIESEDLYQIWKMNIEENPEPIVIYQDTEIGSNHGTVDPYGNIYFYDYETNNIYKIDETSHSRVVQFSNVVQVATVGDPLILYSPSAEGILIAQNDNFVIFPMNGDPSFIFAENVIGIDNGGMYETPEGDIICTHTGQIFKMDKHANSSIDGNSLLDEVILYSNYPNPYKQRTEIKFFIPKASHTTLKMYDQFGNVSQILTDGFLQAGKHSIVLNEKNSKPGVCFLRLETCGVIHCRKMIRLK